MSNRYFGKANAFAQQNFSNYSGYSNLTPTSFMNADASMNAGVGASEPYNFTIANAGTTDVADVVLLGGYENTAAGVTNFGNDSNITIIMDNGSITYAVFLQAIKSEPFSVGQIYLASSNASQLTKTWNITWKESNGQESKLQIYPKIDPMQNNTTALNQWTKFPVNGYTKMTTTIIASTTLSIALYPMTVIDNANALVSRPAEKVYGAPNLSQFRIGG